MTPRAPRRYRLVTMQALCLYSGCASASMEAGAVIEAGVPTEAGASADAGAPAADAGLDLCQRVPVRATTIFPDFTLTDWTSFADHVVAFEVASEAVIPPPDAVTRLGEGYVGRRATLHVHRTVWSNRLAPPLPDPIETTVMGWVLREACSEMLLGYVGYDAPAPRLEVNGRYVAAIVKYTINGNEWGLMTPQSAFAEGADPVATADIAATGNNSVARELASQSLEAVAAKLEATAPYPSVASVLALPAEERLARYYMDMQ